MSLLVTCFTCYLTHTFYVLTYTFILLLTLNAQSHSERMNSSGNLLVTKHRLRLNDEIVNKMVCIKINKPFRDHLLATVYYKRLLSIPGIEKVQDNNDNG